jgi:hypothetical protein
VAPDSAAPDAAAASKAVEEVGSDADSGSQIDPDRIWSDSGSQIKAAKVEMQLAETANERRELQAKVAELEAIEKAAAEKAVAEMAAQATPTPNAAVEKAAAEKAAAEKAAAEKAAAEKAAAEKAAQAAEAAFVAAQAAADAPKAAIVKMQAEKDKAALEAALRDAPPFSARAVEKAEVTRSVAEQGVSAFVTAPSDSIADALEALRATAEVAYGADASAIGAAIRDGGAIPHLVACIGSSDSDVQHSAMSLLGNLLTDVYDRESRATLALFVAAGGLAALQRCLRAPEPTNLYACAALQNVTSLDPFDTCAKLREQGCAADLLTLVSSSDETVSSYATAVLANLRAYDPFAEDDDEVEEAIRMRRLAAIVEQMRTGKAVAAVQGAAIRWIRWVRRRQALLADEAAAERAASLIEF